MFDDFFALFTQTAQNTGVDLLSAVVSVILGFALGLIIAWTYRKTHSGYEYSQSFAVTLVMMATVVSVVILAVGSNAARALSLAGAFAIIRFRLTLSDPKDLAFVFLSMAAGLAVGASLYIYSLIAVTLVCLLLIILTKLQLFAPRSDCRRLKIVIPEDMNYSGVFEKVLDKYCERYKLMKVMNIDLGTLFELHFDISFRLDTDEKAMMDEIRTLNGNLKVTLTVVSHDITGD